MDSREHLETPEQLVSLDKMVHLEHPVTSEQLADQDTLESEEDKDLVVNQDHQES